MEEFKSNVIPGRTFMYEKVGELLLKADFLNFPTKIYK